MKQHIVLLTGMSGAGKSSAMNALEDLCYYCIDNFPTELLPNLEAVINKGKRYEYMALAVSAVDYMQFLNFFENSNDDIQIIFLDASNEELLLRYRFTRRRHPMITNGQASTLEEAIELERDYFNRIAEGQKGTIRFDTTKMSTAELSKRIRNRLSTNEEAEFTITFQSFGFKHGIPLDADLIIDVRFLPNPFYEPALKALTGNDKPVYDYVMQAEETKEFTKRLKAYCDFVFASYKEQNKSHLIVGIGCTGGQHRSVSICNWLYATYKSQYRCFKSHRDSGDAEV